MDILVNWKLARFASLIFLYYLNLNLILTFFNELFTSIFTSVY